MKRPTSTMSVLKLLTVAILAAVVALSGCSLLDNETGTLVLGLSPELSARTIEPNFTMAAASYVVSGTGPNGEVFAQTIVGESSLVQPSLVPGNWMVVVTAYNSETPTDDTKVGAGSTGVTIAAGSVTQASVTVTPLSGPGDLFLTVEFPVDILSSPLITGELVATGDLPTPPPLAFAPAGSRTDSDGTVYEQYGAAVSGIEAGYYRLSLALSDGVGQAWGTVEAVRIIAGKNSEATFTLVQQTNRGGLDLTILTDLQNPFEITFEPTLRSPDNPDADPIFIEPAPVVITASSPAASVDTWEWFLQGSPVAAENVTTNGNSSTVTLNGLGPAVYSLSVVAKSGEVISSESGTVAVEPDSGAYGRIAYVSSASGSAIVSVDAVGGSRTTIASGDGAYYDPEWSPDGSRLLFVMRDGAGKFDPYIANLDPATGLQPVIRGSEATNYNDRSPSWSPDGSAFSVSSFREGKFDIFLADIDGPADGSTDTNLTDDAAVDRFPSWSPDGSFVAYSTIVGGAYEVFAIDIATRTRTQLTNGGSNAQWPDVSPDSGRIVYSARVDSVLQVFVMNADGTGKTQLTFTPTNSQQPAWSPTGEHIVYEDGAPTEIFRMNADGTGVVQVTEDPGAQMPTWTN